MVKTEAPETEAPAELKPIEQLAERVKSLIELLGTTREELKLAMDENSRLTDEAEELRGRLRAAEEQQASQSREREEIRERISGMLEQIEEISLQ